MCDFIVFYYDRHAKDEIMTTDMFFLNIKLVMNHSLEDCKY